ncbi:MAG: DUF2142 domain-containing protein [Elusimicrobiota bacterium]|jgi:uncharacterized membrane protein|nr:DUF2142 domain-containing protein [Elusimicrobiota bacterium]
MSKRVEIVVFIVFCIAVAVLSIFTGLKLHNSSKAGADILTALFVLLSIGISAGAGYIFFSYEKLKIEKIFLMFFIVFGALYLIILPMFGSNDEPNHWKRILQISRGGIIAQSTSQGVGGLLPSNTIVRVKGVKDLFSKFDENNIEFLEFGNTAAYSPISYLLHLPGVIAANLLGDYVFASAYAGRLSCFLLSLVLLYFIIKKLPFKKKTFFVLTTAPLFLQEASSLNADIFIYISSYIAVAFALIYSYGNHLDDKMKIRRLIFIFFLSIAISLMKTVYLPIILIFLMIPASMFKSRKQALFLFSALFIISFAADLIWTIKSSVAYDTGFNNMAFVFAHPISFIILLTRNAAANFLYAIYGSFGGNLGFGVTGESPISLWLIIFYVLSILFVILSEKYQDFKFLHRFLFFIISGSVIVLSIASMIYISINFWQSPNAIIYFTAARYFIPAWFFIALFISSFKIIHIQIDEDKVFKCMLLIIPFIHLSAYSTLITFFTKYL